MGGEIIWPKSKKVAVVVKAADVNWNLYFNNIKAECPWSWVAWRRNLIDIVKWQNTIIDLGPFEARVYVVKNINPRKLKKLCKKLDNGRYEWLWSYPDYGNFATPVYCLIQQDRSKLEKIRNGLI